MDILNITKKLQDKNFVYSEDIIKKINKATGVLKSTIRNICKSLPQAQYLEIAISAAYLIIIKSVNDNSKLLTSDMTTILNKSLKKTFKDMDQLMMTLNCGKKRYDKYSHEWRTKLKIATLHAIIHRIRA